MPHRVVVHGKSVDVPAPRVLLICLHDGFRPLSPSRAIAARTHGDLQHLLLVLLRGIEVPHEAAVDLHLAHVVVERHVAATVPAFVTDAEQCDFVWSGMPVGGTFFCQRRRCCGRHVFQPLGRFLRSAGADIDGDIRVRPDLIDEVHELVRSKRVCLSHAAPVGVESYGSLRADALAPVILIGEAATGPANVRHFDRFQSAHNIVANPARIRDLGIGPDPNTFVNAVSKMLCELPENVAVDLRAGFGRVDRQFHFLGCHHRRSDRHNDQREADKK